MQWLSATRQGTLPQRLTLQGGCWRQTPQLRPKQRQLDKCYRLQRGIWQMPISWIMISETLLSHVEQHMCQFTEDRRMSPAHTVLPGLYLARKGSFARFVILQWLGQMLQGCFVLPLKFDDLAVEAGENFNHFSAQPFWQQRGVSFDRFNICR